MKVVFGYSTRAEQVRFMMLGGALFLITWLLLDLSWMVALFVGGGTAAVYVVLNASYRSWRSSIAVDDDGIEARLGRRRVRIPFDQVTLVDVTASGLPTRDGVAIVRHAIVADALGRRIAFSDLSLLGSARALALAESGQPIVSVGEPEILLALVARRTGNEGLLPAALRSGGPAIVADVDPRAVHASDTSERRVDVAGLGALVVKLGGKLAKAAGGLVSTIKPGFAIASGAVLAVLVDWRFVIAIMAMLMFHEMGHVWAMRRSGLDVRGIYFIPLLGAAAVTDGVWRTRAQQAYIALNGPLWGLYMTVPAFGLAMWLGHEHPVLFGIASFFSLINLFNLLPINPLDGGRLLNAVGHSLHSWIGAGVSMAAFVASFVLAFSLDMGLLVVVGIFGLLEFIAELESWSAMRKLRAAGVGANVPAEAFLALRLATRPVFGPRDEKKLEGMELKRLNRLLSLARIEPMRLEETVAWGLFYLLLATAFVVIIVLLGSTPSGALALDILR